MRSWWRFRWRAEAAAAGYEHERRALRQPDKYHVPTGYVRHMLIPEHADAFIEGQRKAREMRSRKRRRNVEAVLRAAGVDLTRRKKSHVPQPPIPVPEEVWGDAKGNIDIDATPAEDS